MRRRVWAMAAPVLILAALVSGCGERTGTVSGEVTVDNTPLSEGLITYVAADGKTAPVAVKIKDGKYSASVPPGAYKVQISAPQATGEKRQMLPDTPATDVMAESLAERLQRQNGAESGRQGRRQQTRLAVEG